jgi:hypothetical protein
VDGNTAASATVPAWEGFESKIWTADDWNNFTPGNTPGHTPGMVKRGNGRTRHAQDLLNPRNNDPFFVDDNPDALTRRELDAELQLDGNAD